jgi:hypothetical protein
MGNVCIFVLFGSIIVYVLCTHMITSKRRKVLTEIGFDEATSPQKAGEAIVAQLLTRAVDHRRTST